MTTKLERPEFWDDELEVLSERATAILGDGVVGVAIERLFRQMRSAGTPVASFERVQGGVESGATAAREAELMAGNRDGAPLAVVINQTMARMYFGATDPLGQRLLMRRASLRPSNTPAEGVWDIVGVMVDEGVSWFEGQTPQPIVYVAREQEPAPAYQKMVVKTSIEPARVEASIRQAVAAVDRDQALADLKPLDQLESEETVPDRLRSWLCSALAAIAIGLAALGLYGVLSYAVVQRTRELGIRAALGASPTQLVTLVMRQGLVLTGCGLGLGSVAAVAIVRILRASLADVGPIDPVLLAGAVGVVTVVTLLACYVPARRATRADPLIAIKAE